MAISDLWYFVIVTPKISKKNYVFELLKMTIKSKILNIFKKTYNMLNANANAN